MKVMDNSIKDSDCSLKVITPMKKKKMKQARLPFQLLSASDSPNSISKKRKLTSPSIEHKMTKIVKIAKENSVKNIPDIEVIEIDEPNSDISTDTMERTNNGDIETANTSSEKVTPKRPAGKRRSDMSGMSGALTKFLKKPELEKDLKGNVEQGTEYKTEDKDLKNEDKHVSVDIEKSKEENASKKSDEDEDEDDEDDVEDDEQDEEDEEDQNVSVQNTSKNVTADSDADVTNISSGNEGNDEEDRCIRSEASMAEHSQGNKLKKLTPKQLERKIEIAKKREERMKLKMEKEKKREEERENKRKEREQKRKKKEEKEQAEKEQKRKERELKDLKKQMEIEQKQKEKEAKEEERRKKEEAKEEEKRKKEEEKLELKRKKQKAATNFASFFVAKKQEAKSVEDEGESEIRNFMPFEVKADMRIAPLSRRTLSEAEKKSLIEQCEAGGLGNNELYIEEMRRKKIIPRQSKKTWEREAKDDVIILDDESDQSNLVEATEPIAKHRAKFLQFTENRRPGYWGTWRKTSKFVKGRKPFSTDSTWFDYDVDSDEEWEEEEPGESLRGSDDEKDEENAEDNEYEVDNEFMVPHGYLSDEEARADEEEKEDMTPETQKYKLKLLGEEFEAEMNAKTSRLKPKIIGCIWQGPDNEFPESVPAKVIEYLSARKAWVHKIPIELNNSPLNEAGTTNSPLPQSSRRSRKRLPEEALPDLIKLVHGNMHGRGFLIKEFMTFLGKKNPGGQLCSKMGLGQKIREIGRWMACPEEGPMHLKACWYVSEEIRNQYLKEPLTLPNSWSYNLTPRRKSEGAELIEKSEKEDKEKDKEKVKEKEKERKNVPLITQFTKRITPEELKKQMAPKPQPIVQSSNQSVNQPISQSLSQFTKPSGNQPVKQKTPKRVQLISVPRDKQLPNSSGESLLSKFISKMTKVKENVDEDNDIVVLDHIAKDTHDKADSANVHEKKSQTDKKVTFNISESVSQSTNDTNSVSYRKICQDNNICKEVRIVLTPMEVDE